MSDLTPQPPSSGDFPELDTLLESLCAGHLTHEASTDLVRRLNAEPAARWRYLLYLEVHTALHRLYGSRQAEALELLDSDEDSAPDPRHQQQILPALREVPDPREELPPPPPIPAMPITRPRRKLIFRWGAAAILVLGVTLASILMHRNRQATVVVDATPKPVPPSATFVAALSPAWSKHAPAPGDVMLPGWRELASGVIKLHFADGADALIEGPAIFDAASGARLDLKRGKATISVNGPPSSRTSPGQFTVTTPQARIVDLGTEFGVIVEQSQAAEVQVFRGAVAVKSEAPGAQSGPGTQPIHAGGSVRMEAGSGRAVPTAAKPIFIREAEFSARSLSSSSVSPRSAATFGILRDPRVVALYQFDPAPTDLSALRELTHPNGSADGRISGANWAAGRLPGTTCLSFAHPGEFAKISVPGSFSQLTLAAWINIATLQVPWAYSLLMTNDRGSGTNYVHWQVHAEGYLSLATFPAPGEPNFRSPVVFTPPSLNSWHHVATVFDQPGNRVSFYFDGVEISSVTSGNAKPVMIGEAHIGNWESRHDEGRDRSFHGEIQDLVIFRTALSPQEIRALAKGSG